MNPQPEELPKRSYKFLSKYQVQFDDWKLKQQRVKKRNIIRWTCHEYQKVREHALFLKEHLKALKATKRIQTLKMERFGSYTLRGKLLREGLKRQRSIKKFDFNFVSDGNKSDQHLKGYVESLKKLPSLRNIHLQFYSSGVSDKGLQKLNQALKGLCFLRNIDLLFEKAYKITDYGMLKMSEALKILRAMKSIKLSFESNEITEKGLRALDESLKELKLLQEIDFNFS